MTKRILEIDDCEQCCYFDDYYYDYNETCLKLGRKIPTDHDGVRNIPEDCPLEKVSDEN